MGACVEGDGLSWASKAAGDQVSTVGAYVEGEGLSRAGKSWAAGG
jgi:hypothetical protein